MGEPAGSDGAWSMRVYYKPFVDWIWGGAIFMIAGGIFAIAARRHKSLQRSASGETL